MKFDHRIPANITKHFIVFEFSRSVIHTYQFSYVLVILKRLPINVIRLVRDGVNI